MKKAFKLLIIALGILILIFLSLGIFNPDISYKNSIIVTASPEEAFQVFTDTSIMRQWITGLSRIEFVEGQMNSIGSKWKLFINQEGKQYEMLETMTSYEVNHRFSFLLDNDVLASDVDIRFTPSPQGTIITIDNKVKGKNILWRSLFFISANYFKDTSQKMYDNLKLIINKSQVAA